MFGKYKGYIGIKPKITHSREPGMSPFGDYSLTEDYFNALQGKTVPIIDIAVDDSSYLVLGRGEKSGPFIWDIDKEDTSQQVIPYKFFHPGPTAREVKRIDKCPKCGGINPALHLVLQNPEAYIGDEPLTRTYALVCLNCGQAIEEHVIGNTRKALAKLRDQMDETYGKSEILPTIFE